MTNIPVNQSANKWFIEINAKTLPETPSEIRAWLKEHRVDEVECIVPDIAGVARGKAMPAEKFAALKPAYMADSIFYQTITGDYVDIEDIQDQWRERDVCLVPDMSTVRTVPWAAEPSIQVIHDLFDMDGKPVGLAPRSVLKRVVSMYEELGLTPITAPEIEFYLTKQNRDPREPLEPPVGRSGRQSVGRQAYSMAAVDDYETVIDDIYDFAEAQGLGIDAISKEGGAAQLEINLTHGDPVKLADQVFLFKRLIREAAFKHGIYATFMAKPMDGEPGSSMHLHHSVVDQATGRNLFSDENGNRTEEFLHFIGGLQTYMPAAMLIFAPYVNSYRRVAGGYSAPGNLEWSSDNRLAGIRIPHSDPENRRVENRVVGSDANPYLATAASLACGLLGIKNKIKPRAEMVDAVEGAGESLPGSIGRALQQFEDCTDLHEVLGKEFSMAYVAIKKHEQDEFMRVISPWEREHLLLTV